ncbi:hypothetical protein WG947_10460 [Pontibacter sp. H259]|uniref:hypothetical protein n=1 Tax=Pontibacter sp. H259 TaxID=3133421 RepID=UPI0030BF044E
MNFRSIPQLVHRATGLFTIIILSGILTTACQPTEEKVVEEAVTVTNQVTAADTTERRPAPTFYIIPKGMERKRMWVCDDNMSDVFHKSNTCELLKGCTGIFKNVSLQRAIEEYGRYNCEICSNDLADIFNENKVR